MARVTRGTGRGSNNLKDYSNMKPVQPAEAASTFKGTAQPEANGWGAMLAPNEPADAAQTDKVADLGIVERRRFIRAIPVPDAMQSNGDTDWATFQTLISATPRT
jgi:hypothetical protein